MTRMIHIYGDECLRRVSEPVPEVTDEIRRLAREMGETMYAAKGVGLAAAQVGVALRLFVCDTDYARDEKNASPKRNLRVFVNPEITWESAEDAPFTEGCLSIPGVEGEVYRPVSVKVRYLDEAGVARERQLTGLEARCAQHEIDHLNGALFVDRMPLAKRQLLAGKLNALKRGRQTEPARPAGAPARAVLR